MTASPSIVRRSSSIPAGLIALVLPLLSCTSMPETRSQPEVSSPSVASADEVFQRLRQDFIDNYLKLYPVAASSLGEHRYDALWSDYSKNGEAKVKEFTKKYQTALAAIDRRQLSPDNVVDAAVLENELAASLFSLDSLRTLEISAIAYVGIISSGLDALISREYATPKLRAKALTQRLYGVPGIVAIAKERIENPSQLDTETSIAQARGVLDLCQNGIKPLVESVPEQSDELKRAADVASSSIKDLIRHLEKVVLPRTNRDFRLGKELYTKKMQFDLVDDIKPDDLALQARKALDKTLEDMYQVALLLSPELLAHPSRPTTSPKEKRKLIRSILNRMALEQPTDETLFQDAEAAITSATAFIREKKILTIPDETCKVIRMPAFNQGVAGAYSESSGPFEEKFENFVALEPPLPADRESFYREYNKSMLLELMLHEAMPGHCLQAMHAVQTKNPLRAMFGNGPYAEGWAMYSEEVMAAHGFGGNRIKMVQLKLLARAIANTILDYGVHVKNMSEKDAMHLLMEETFQEKSEAVGKWRRVRLSSVQLTTYFYGYQQFVAMRKAAEKQPGFQELNFHDQLLDSGAPPLKLLRARFGL